MGIIVDSGKIELRGVRVHNLRDIDLDIPHGQLVSICGLSGSGKSSLAFDTLDAEGQRRYFDSLSTYTRQFLEQLERPDADRIDGIPPAIAIRASRHSGASSADRHRTTVGTASEIVEYLRLMFAKIGRIVCPDCGVDVVRHDPDSVIQFLDSLPDQTRFQIAFRKLAEDTVSGSAESGGNGDEENTVDWLRRGGFRRVIVDGTTRDIDGLDDRELERELLVVVDRLKKESGNYERPRGSLETAFEFGRGTATLLFAKESSGVERDGSNVGESTMQVDSQNWSARNFSRALACSKCDRTFPTPQPQLFSFSNPAGACSECEGFGSILKLDTKLIVPDPTQTIRGGAIAPWNTPAYEHERFELLELAGDYSIDVDVPFGELPKRSVQLIWDGVAEREFGGLTGFFKWLERRKYKIQIAVFLNRWKSSELCPGCKGARLNRAALSFRVGDLTIAEICGLEIRQAAEFFSALELYEHEQRIAAKITNRISRQLDYLQRVGLGYLSLNRTVASLSSGEAQRVMLTKVLGSTLSSMLYVLDEPTAGLHSVDTPALIESVRELNRRGNTVVVVDHEPQMILSADRVIEIGPEAGAAGGEIVFDGNSLELLECESSVTGAHLNGTGGLRNPDAKRRTGRGSIIVEGASGNNLADLTVRFPLGCLCVVTGVSGSGKSSLVQETLYPAICEATNIGSRKGLPHAGVSGTELIDEVVLIDQSPIGRSSRSNPVTYVKAFDDIRQAFAETVDAKQRNFKAGHFSFNVEGGRCETCRGEGQLTIDMQFMTDIHVRCDQCNGTRFREEILNVRFRARNIHEVLNMTAREAFGFFRGQKKVQMRLKSLMDVGLDYIRLGQPSSTLSSGEAQRLKLAHYLNASTTRRALFLLDEPTFGLHMRDVVKLADCFDTLIAAGHSLIVVEHNLQLIKHADWIIDLGPGAADKGGQIVAEGPPEEVAGNAASPTGTCLRLLFDAESKYLQNVPD